MRIIRVLAQLIDLFVCFAILILSFLKVPPVLFRFTSGSVANGVLVLVIAILLMVAVQYPFLKDNQTVGKAFFGLEIESTIPHRPVNLSLLLHRELLCKLMSCYIICFPVLIDRPGGHETATATRVVRRRKKARTL